MIEKDKVEELYNKLKSFEKRGYLLNPDSDFTLSLIESLLVNEDRYGYQACPCRLASGDRNKDRDIICPCDYRDPDLVEFGACYCGLYVSKQVHDGSKKLQPIPDRRGSAKKEINMPEPEVETPSGNKPPIWRCQVCGYLAAREEAPDVCPICGATHDRFERYER